MVNDTKSEQFEYGFTMVPNEVLEGLAAAALNGTQFRIVLLVMRETYGFQRKGCQLSETYIAARLGMKRQNIHREIRPLLDKRILLTVKEPTFTASREIALNKDNLIFQRLQKSKMNTVIENDSSTGIELDSHRNKPSQETFIETSQKTPPRKEIEVGLREGKEENGVIPPSVPQGGDAQQPDGHCAGGGAYSEGFNDYLNLFPEKTPEGSKGIAWAQWQQLNPSEAQTTDILSLTTDYLADRPDLFPSYILGQYINQTKKTQ